MNSYKSYTNISNISSQLSNSMNSKYISNSNTIKPKYISKKKKYKNKNIFVIKNIKKYFKNKNIKYNLENRIFYYDNIINKLSILKNDECLNVVKENNSKSYIYTIKNISLDKRIGSSSKYGYIYITKIKNELGKRPIAAKLMIQDVKNIHESDLNKQITDIIIKKKLSKHFILTYKIINCNHNINNNLPDIINRKKYIILLNELAHGDLKTLCKRKEFLMNDEILYNVFSQIMLSILTFQQFGYVHRDCHWGNFLYHYMHNDIKNNNKYYHYNINKKNYYLKSSIYSIYIYDFGLSKNIKYVNTYAILNDYLRILPAFINQNIKGSWLKKLNIDYKLNIPINIPSDNFSNFILNFEKKLMNTFYTNKNREQKSKYLNIISDTLISTLLSLPNNMFTDKKPLKNIIINKKPYYINNKIKLKLYSSSI